MDALGAVAGGAVVGLMMMGFQQSTAEAAATTARDRGLKKEMRAFLKVRGLRSRKVGGRRVEEGRRGGGEEHSGGRAQEDEQER
jgi:hypothetical protein